VNLGLCLVLVCNLCVCRRAVVQVDLLAPKGNQLLRDRNGVHCALGAIGRDSSGMRDTYEVRNRAACAQLKYVVGAAGRRAAWMSSMFSEIRSGVPHFAASRASSSYHDFHVIRVFNT
jgi:hypothetical protein